MKIYTGLSWPSQGPPAPYSRPKLPGLAPQLLGLAPQQLPGLAPLIRKTPGAPLSPGESGE